MSDRLDQETLKSEIAKTRAHLEWLESLVEEPEKQFEPSVAASPEPAERSAAAVEEVHPEAESAPEPDNDYLFNTLAQSEPTMAGEFRKFKIGCIGIAIILGGGLIFMIYGLPYLMD